MEETLRANLGKLAKDKVTGYEGVITAYCVSLYGCNQYMLTAKVRKENKREDSGNGWYDEGRIEIVGPGVKPKSVRAAKPGGENLPAPGSRN